MDILVTIAIGFLCGFMCPFALRAVSALRDISAGIKSICKEIHGLREEIDSLRETMRWKS